MLSPTVNNGYYRTHEHNTVKSSYYLQQIALDAKLNGAGAIQHNRLHANSFTNVSIRQVLRVSASVR